MMEVRDPRLHYLKVKLFFPRIFFCRCKHCNLEYRSTLIWRLCGFEDREYLCMNCAPSYMDVLVLEGIEPPNEDKS
jgi:hypothetical protein